MFHQRFYRSRLTLSVLLLASFSASVFGQTNDSAERLARQSSQFDEQVVKVAEGVYTSVGTSVSNVTMIVGNDGVVVVDTGMQLSSAEKIVKRFREITDLPVKAIIFTHSHGDHTRGAAAFFGKERPQIWAHANFGSEDRPLTDAGITIQRLRGARQAGFRLPPEQRINNGIAPARYPQRGGSIFASKQDTRPTHHVSESEQVTIAGITLELTTSLGETNDQLSVWLPKQRVLMAGDNFYRSFPNLYAIRGTPNRSVKLWAESLDTMLAREPVALIGGHTLPVIGEQQVRDVLTNYRDAVKFIHDKTVEGMNQGMTPDQLVEYVQLPEHLASEEYLQPFYGNPQWGVRSVFNFYMGWFDGNPSNLFRLPRREEAERMASLAGGQKELVAAAEKALEAGDAQWCAQLCDHLIALMPDSPTPKTLKARALKKLAADMVTATARNYYLTVAAELEQTATP